VVHVPVKGAGIPNTAIFLPGGKRVGMVMALSFARLDFESSMCQGLAC